MSCEACGQEKHGGCCTCCWYPKACPKCGMCDKCGYYPVDINWITNAANTMMNWANEHEYQEQNK